MLKRIYRMSLITSIVLFIFGLLLILNAEGFIKSVSTIIGIILLLIGMFPVVDYFRYKKDGFFPLISLISGIFSIVCGLMLLINNSLLLFLIPIVIGVWMIINGVNKIQIAFNVRDKNEKSWIITFIFSILIIILGAYFIINPISGAKIVTNTLGIIICIYSLIDIIDCIIIKVKIKNFEDTIDNISNSNIVDEQ